MEENTKSNNEGNNKKSNDGRNTPIKVDGDQSDSKEIKKDSNKKVINDNKKTAEKDIDKKNNIITVKEDLGQAFNQHKGELEQEMKDLNLELQEQTAVE